jgi:glycosyltransferase involved in cell wall biosynthesis
MKILLSAFAFAPNVGSEPGVGWRWAVELARHHEVTVVTDVTRRGLVEAVNVLLPPNIRVVYFRPCWLRSVPLNSKTAQLLYTVWQFGLLGFARGLQREHGFDLVIHCTYSVFRHPSFLGYLGIPFVFGPLGGGEDAPLVLKRSLSAREKTKELLRSLINKAALFDPFLWLAYARATLILTSTEQTRCALPWVFRKRAVVFPNLGIDAIPDAKACERKEGEPLRILFAGRLLGWKGVHFAIRALAATRKNGVDVELTILGSGPYEQVLKQLAVSKSVDQSIFWLGQQPQSKLFELYRSMHGFIFPSLHDSGGTVVLEAQVHGLPVICLDLGGPATLVRPETAIVVATTGLNEDGVVAGLADALVKLASDEEGRLAMAQEAIAHARSMSWEKRVLGVFPLLEGVKHGN